MPASSPCRRDGKSVGLQADRMHSTDGMIHFKAYLDGSQGTKQLNDKHNMAQNLTDETKTNQRNQQRGGKATSRQQYQRRATAANSMRTTKTQATQTRWNRGALNRRLIVIIVTTATASDGRR